MKLYIFKKMFSEATDQNPRIVMISDNAIPKKLLKAVLFIIVDKRIDKDIK